MGLYLDKDGLSLVISKFNEKYTLVTQYIPKIKVFHLNRWPAGFNINEAFQGRIQTLYDEEFCALIQSQIDNDSAWDGYGKTLNRIAYTSYNIVFLVINSNTYPERGAQGYNIFLLLNTGYMLNGVTFYNICAVNYLFNTMSLLLNIDCNNSSILVSPRKNLATSEELGFLSSDDFVKLSSIENNATADTPIDIESISSLFNVEEQ